jgi:molybdenum cofactor cytidylyltransferase
MTEIPILLLAAGSSTRMGQPKQLLPWGNTTLIEYQIQTLNKTGNPVNVVLGSDSNLIIPVIENYKINIYINSNWESGMGSSVSMGISQIIRYFPKAEGVLITLLDQPLLTASYFEKILDTFQPGSQQIIVSHSTSGWRGVPVLFDQFYFKELSELKNDEGAKKIFQQYEKNVIVVDAGEILEDIDTPQAYELLLNKFQSIIQTPGS